MRIRPQRLSGWEGLVVPNGAMTELLPSSVVARDKVENGNMKVTSFGSMGNAFKLERL